MTDEHGGTASETWECRDPVLYAIDEAHDHALTLRRSLTGRLRVVEIAIVDLDVPLSDGTKET